MTNSSWPRAGQEVAAPCGSWRRSRPGSRPRPLRDDAVAADRRDDGLAREAVAEVVDAVVVADDLDVAVVVRVVEGQQLAERAAAGACGSSIGAQGRFAGPEGRRASPASCPARSNASTKARRGDGGQRPPRPARRSRQQRRARGGSRRAGRRRVAARCGPAARSRSIGGEQFVAVDASSSAAAAGHERVEAAEPPQAGRRPASWRLEHVARRGTRRPAGPCRPADRRT